MEEGWSEREGDMEEEEEEEMVVVVVSDCGVDEVDGSEKERRGKVEVRWVIERRVSDDKSGV